MTCRFHDSRLQLLGDGATQHRYHKLQGAAELLEDACAALEGQLLTNLDDSIHQDQEVPQITINQGLQLHGLHHFDQLVLYVGPEGLLFHLKVRYELFGGLTNNSLSHQDDNIVQRVGELPEGLQECLQIGDHLIEALEGGFDVLLGPEDTLELAS